ncbi:MAG TPA: filamentous hemagglutinin N-terminal domain-containing protein, partial [Stellaceae bacterium]|nr:filamentous hemagglutinin N-terminal domain-containing protein [Stellaceae bacterium]
MLYPSIPSLKRGLLATTALVAALSLGGVASAGGSSSKGLSGFNVVSGGATLSTPTPDKSIITQSTNKAIITWSAFGIPAGSTVQFIQPGRSSVALNRVTGGSVSSILGDLIANGQVWIVNPAGVFFGPGAQVDVAGLMATSADIKNADFLSGNYQFGIASQNPNAGIVNQGTIRTTGGSAVLAGAQVTNQGLIEAQLGSVVLGGAKTFTVDFQGDKLLSFQVTGAVDQRPNDASGSPANALVTNSGTVSASGGTVLITARAAKNIIDNVINSSGIVEATSAKQVNGEIVLDGGDSGAVTVSGSLDASGKGAGQTGGTVQVLGNQVNLASTANIDVSGDAGGGTALIGGNFHGQGPQANAAATTVSAGATINASAITKGNGGKVAVWSDTHTTFGGTVTATGGSLGGSGGFVETSGKSLSIGATAKVDTSAAKGTAGSWLLDPTDFTIATTGGDMTPTQVTSALGSNNVLIQTDGNLVLAASSDLVYSSTNALSLLAQQNAALGSNIQNSSYGAVNIVAGWDGATGVSGTTSGFNSSGIVNMAEVFANTAAYGLNGGSITSSGFISTAGGAINLAASGVTVAGTVGANGAPGTTNVNGGAITIMASGVVDLASGVSSTGANQSSAAQVAGSGGAIQITSAGDVTLGQSGGPSVNARGGNNNSAGAGSGGTAGGVSITSTGGSIDLAAGIVDRGGNAYGSSGNGGNSGNIILGASSGTISIGATPGNDTIQNHGGYGSGAGNGGDSGTVALSASGNISIGASVGYNAVQDKGGDKFSTLGGNGGNAGAISITSTGGSINLAGSIVDRGGNHYAGPGNGGSGDTIALSAFGDISITGTGGSPAQTNNAINARGGDAGVSGTGGNGAAVSIAAGGLVTINTSAGTFAVLTRGGDAGAGAGGAGGSIVITAGDIETSGAIVSRGGDALFGTLGTTNGGLGGNAAGISLMASTGNISIGITTTGLGNLPNILGNPETAASVSARGGDTDGTAGGGMGASVILSAPSGSITAGVGLAAGTTLVPTFSSAISVRGGD